jgi:hypothetical protein
MNELYEIRSDATGIKSFVGTLGKELKRRLNANLEPEKRINVRFTENPSDRYYHLIWELSGSQYTFSGNFSIHQKNREGSDLTIDRFPGVSVRNGEGWAEPRASQTELELAKEMDAATEQFLITKFGESTSKRGNGCPIYKGKLPG